MKILFTGGGSGGHFYPIIAIAQKVNELVQKEKILDAKLYFMSDSPYNKAALYENEMVFVFASAGKMRRYFSLLNLIDIFKTAIGVVKAFWSMYLIYPDVVVGKGGYASFPALMAAKLLKIPVVIHESDSFPGRTNLWAGKFAERIAVSYEEAGKHFPMSKVAFTGQPVRKEILIPLQSGAYEYLKLKKDIPTILILGGSFGAKLINEAVVDILPELLEKYQVIHQVGGEHMKETEALASVVLANSEHKDRYRVFGYLNSLALRMAAGTASVIISRGGSTLFEIAAWGLPSIIIPITDSNGDHQRKNAFNYGRSGAAVIIEEVNLSPHLLLSEITGIMENAERKEKMSKEAKAFYKEDAAEKIAKEVLKIALRHEK
ncbi:MAG: UDP-N-acetylglucosamine--N-acetylmuramyl-(pentapeptide) pyrophosphoryl-undecaprenol N-acetylglucosamine transferase [Candidatus Paceibacterota bacterium]|jgi:UDP-N-acetylglucosamine--N-acetylmuramyl-(pentapeptide) pyrophosphoryl-undecaprenol N-acetylglucosamine transferase